MREPLLRTDRAVARTVLLAALIAIALLTLSSCGDGCNQLWPCK